MFDWVYKLVGKSLSNKLGLKEGTLVDTKKWYLSKTLWAAILYVVVGGIETISSSIGTPITIPQLIKELLIGLGLYGLRTAQKPIA